MKVDFAFLSNAGLDMLPLGTILANKRMREDLNIVVKEVKTVCLSLNHSGNWSSLISRCDTDGLIVLLFELSKDGSISVPELSKKLGINASVLYSRIKRLVKKKLIKMGYVNDKKILDDEIHAFMSTGLYNGLNTKELKVYEKEFKKNFSNFTK